MKDRLGLDVSPEKSRIVNLKRQYSEFLGFKLKVQKRSNKYVVKSHMCDKAYKKVQKKLTEEVKKLEHSADDKAQFMQLMTYNAVVAGIHQYYCIATAVSEDFGKLAYGVKKQMHNRLRNDLTRKGELKKRLYQRKVWKKQSTAISAWTASSSYWICSEQKCPAQKEISQQVYARRSETDSQESEHRH